MKNKIILSLGLMSITTLPLLATISCSNNSSKTISVSKETQTKYYDTLWSDELSGDMGGTYEYLNLLSDSLIKTEATETKTKEDVQKIAEDKLANINESELKELMLNSAIKGATKSTNKNNQKYLINYLSKEINFDLANLKMDQDEKMIVDIQDFKYDKENQTISFTYFIEHTIVYTLDGVSGSQKMNNALAYKNIKLKASTFEVNNKVMPIITFSQDQPNASIEMIQGIFKTDVNELIDKVVEIAKKENPDLPIDGNMIKEMIKTYSKKMNETYNKIKALKDTLGQENGKFQMIIGYEDTYGFDHIAKSILFMGDSLGYRIMENESGSELEITTQSASINSPIFFSSEYKDGKAKWEIYNLSR